MKCLTGREIEQTLADADSPLPGQWENHFATCQSCRNRLEETAGSNGDWESTIRVLEENSAEFEAEAGTESGKYESSIFYRLNWQQDSSRHDEAIEEPTHQVDLAPPSHPENLGRIGRYEIERSVGRGGMGIVFKGFDAELNRPIAIKILSPHLSGHGTARQRFTREAKAAAAVVHDNVVPIYDIHADSRQPYLVMPYVNGLSLQEYVDEKGQLGSSNLLQVALQVASGLSAAHAQGLIHRDIKPANILLENGLNRVQLTDFGLARAVDDAAMTHSGMIAGTPHYMSPEQAKGESLDHRSDLFSLGCVMYFMATGRTLHRGEGPFSIISQLCQGEYVPVREVNSRVPLFVADIIDKLLEQNPHDRFQSAKQLVDHLEKALAHIRQPTSKPAPRRIWNSRKRKTWRRVFSSSVASFSIAVVGLIVWSGASNDGSTPVTPNSSSEHHTPPTLSLMAPSELDQNLDSIERELQFLESQLISGSNPSFPGSGNVENYSLEQQLLQLENAVQDPYASFPSGSNPSSPIDEPLATRHNGANLDQQKSNSLENRFSNQGSRIESTTQNGSTETPENSFPEQEIKDPS